MVQLAEGRLEPNKNLKRKKKFKKLLRKQLDGARKTIAAITIVGKNFGRGPLLVPVDGAQFPYSSEVSK